MLRRLLTWATDLLLGYDVFISYARRDGTPYATLLHGALVRSRYRTFLDTNELASGTDLSDEVSRALRRSSSFLLIGTRGAFESEYVKREVLEFAATARPLTAVMMVDWPSAMDPAVADVLSRRIRVNETPDPLTQGPSSPTLKQLQQSFNFIRRTRIRMAIAVGVAAAFGVIAVIAILQRDAAIREALRVQLQLNAMVNTDMLASGEQGQVLRLALADARRAEDRLGGVPIENWNVLRSALEGSRELGRFDVGTLVGGITLSADERAIVTISRSGSVSGWSWTGTRLWNWSIGDDDAPMGVTPSGRGIYVRQGTRVDLYTLQGALVWTYDSGEKFGQPLLDISDDGREVVFSPDRQRAYALETTTATLRPLGDPLAEDGPRVAALAVSGDGTTGLRHDSDGAAALYRLRPHAELQRSFWMPAGQLFTDQRFEQIDVVTDHGVQIVSGPDYAPDPAAARAIAGSGAPPQTPNFIQPIPTLEAFAATFENDGEVMLFDTQGARLLGPILGGDHPFVTVTRRGDRLVAGDYLQRSIRIYDLTPRSVRRLLDPCCGDDGDRDWTTALTYCQASRALVWGGARGTVRVARAAGVDVLGKLHDDYVESIACVGRGFASSGRDGRLHYVPAIGETAVQDLTGNDGTAILLAAGTTEDTLFGLLGSHLLVFAPDKQSAPVADWDLVALSGNRISAPERMVALPATHEIAVVGRASTGSYVAVWEATAPPHLTWVETVPEVMVPWSVASDRSGQHLLVGGAFDRIVLLDRETRGRQTWSSVVRPGPADLQFVTADVFAAASLWGSVGLWRTNGARLDLALGPLSHAVGPVHLAGSIDQHRLFAAGTGGTAIEIVLDARDLVQLGCEALGRHPDPNEPPDAVRAIAACGELLE